MADQYLDPEQGSQPGGAPAPGANGPGIADAWRGFLQEPSNRAFMLQAGLALMQPRPVGQSTMGHLASGISQGGAAANAVQVADERRAEAESVQTARAKSTDARLMGADAALSRAAATETNADTRRMLAEKGGGATPNAQLQARLRMQTSINRWLQSDPLGFNQDDPYLSTLGVKTKSEALQRYNSDPAFRLQLETLFGRQELPAPGGQGPGTVAPPESAAPGMPPGVPPDAVQAPDGHWYTQNPPGSPKPYRLWR